jgi:hypothetical protein
MTEEIRPKDLSIADIESMLDDGKSIAILPDGGVVEVPSKTKPTLAELEIMLGSEEAGEDSGPRIVPVQGYSAGIPWSMHLRAWDVYARKWGRSQSAERLAERGGFHVDELDEFIPGWREEVGEITQLSARVAELEAELAAQKALRIEQVAIGYDLAWKRDDDLCWCCEVPGQWKVEHDGKKYCATCLVNRLVGELAEREDRIKRYEVARDEEAYARQRVRVAKARIVELETECERLRGSLQEVNAVVEDREAFVMGGPAQLCGRLIRITRAAIEGDEQ